MNFDEYMEPAEAGSYINPAHPVPPTTLQFWRHKGRGPRYFKVGRRIVYARADLDDFRLACRHDPEACDFRAAGR
jgi:hypothetical protein